MNFLRITFIFFFYHSKSHILVLEILSLVSSLVCPQDLYKVVSESPVKFSLAVGLSAMVFDKSLESMIFQC